MFSDNEYVDWSIWDDLDHGGSQSTLSASQTSQLPGDNLGYFDSELDLELDADALMNDVLLPDQKEELQTCYTLDPTYHVYDDHDYESTAPLSLSPTDVAALTGLVEGVKVEGLDRVEDAKVEGAEWVGMENLEGAILHLPDSSEENSDGVTLTEESSMPGNSYLLPLSVSTTDEEDDVTSTTSLQVVGARSLWAGSVARGGGGVSKSVGRRGGGLSLGQFSDEYLATVTTKDFNHHLRSLGISNEKAQELKHHRRTLKNRGYAAQCRQKRVSRQSALSRENDALQQQIAELKRQLQAKLAECEQMRRQMAFVKRHVVNSP